MTSPLIRSWRPRLLLIIGVGLLGCGSAEQRRVDLPLTQAQIAEKEMWSELTELLSLSQPIALGDASILKCAPPQTASSSALPLTLLLDPQEIVVDSALEASLRRWASWLQRKRVTFALKIDDTHSYSVDQLEELRVLLDVTLRRLGWPLGRPPLRAWDTPPPSRPAPRAKSLSLLEAGWLPLHQLSRSTQVTHVKLESIGPRDLSRSGGDPTEPLSQETQCQALLKRLSQLEVETSVKPLGQVAASVLSPGLRLIKAPRPPISKTCAQLFGLNEHLIKRDRDDRDIRWHLVLRRLSRALTQVTSEREKSDVHNEYLTLPLPLNSSSLPSITDPVLSALWERRDLWWGAQGCWHQVRDDELSVPLTEDERRWVNLRSETSSRAISMPWLSPHAPLSQVLPALALERESLYPLKVSTRGVISAILDAGQPIPQRAAPPRLVALWSRGAPRGFLLGGITSLTPYEALAQLSGDQALYQVALRGHTSLGPVLYLPRDGRTPPPGWRVKGLKLLGMLNQAGARLSEGDLVTIDAELTDARWLLGEPTQGLQDSTSIFKERLTRLLSTKDERSFGTSVSAGEALTFRGGPWLGVQRHQVTAPLALLPK